MTASLGIDVGGSCIKAAITDDSKVIGCVESPRYSRPTFAELADALRLALSELPGEDEPVACGMCVPGRIGVDGEVEQSVNIPDLVGIRPCDLVSEAIGWDVAEQRVMVFPDVRAAAYGWWIESGRPRGRLLSIALGTGSGACVLDDGEPLRVSGESSGHFGQLDVSLSEDAPIGPDGGRGSLEAYLGLPALVARYGDGVDDAIRAMTVEDEPVRALVRAIRIAHAMYRPEHVVLLGGVGVLLRGIVADIDAGVRDQLTGVAREGWTLTVGDDGFHGARGAAWSAMIQAGGSLP